MLSGHRTSLAQPRRAGKSTRHRFRICPAVGGSSTTSNQENRAANDRALNTTGRRAMKRRDFMKLGAGLGAAGLAGGLPVAAHPPTKAVFKASDVQPPGYPTVAATEN